MHALTNFSDLLPFELCHICDLKYRVNAGKEKENIFGNRFLIENIFKCNLSDSDTIIIGHLEKLTSIIGDDFLVTLSEMIQSLQLNVFMFDDFFCSYLKGYKKEKLYVVSGNEYEKDSNKLYYIEKPVIGVMGTSSMQGKYTLQLQMRKELKKRGYIVGELGTEPSGKLFGFDYQFVYGYNVSEKQYGNEENVISILNLLMHKIDLKKNDIIIVGSQSGTVPMAYSNIGQLPLRQQAFVLGTNPDYVILCINIFDDREYICRTIKYIEGLGDNEVIALVVNPRGFKNDWLYNYGIMEMQTPDKISEFCERASEYFGLPIFIIGDTKSIEDLTDLIIEKFAEE